MLDTLKLLFQIVRTLPLRTAGKWRLVTTASTGLAERFDPDELAQMAGLYSEFVAGNRRAYEESDENWDASLPYEDCWIVGRHDFNGHIAMLMTFHVPEERPGSEYILMAYSLDGDPFQLTKNCIRLDEGSFDDYDSLYSIALTLLLEPHLQ